MEGKTGEKGQQGWTSFYIDVLETQLRALCMLSKQSTAELQSQPFTVLYFKMKGVKIREHHTGASSLWSFKSLGESQNECLASDLYLSCT